VNDANDLAVVDPLEIHGGNPEVGMAQLALDDVVRNALAGHLDRVRMSELMRREPPPNPRADGELAQRRAGGGRRPWIRLQR
jgi:hypothetical protein